MKEWQRYPALFYAAALIAGISSFFGYWQPLLIGCTAHRKTTLIGFFLIAMFGFGEAFLLHNPLPSYGSFIGEAIFQVKQIQKSPHLRYEGKLKCFIAKKEIFYDVPCSIKWENPPLLGDHDYRIKGTLSVIEGNFYKIQISQLEKIEGSFSLAKIRFTLKERLRAYLKKEIPDEKSYWLFASLATGDIESKYLRASFSKVGLTHTLAISGFHYSSLILCIGSFLRIFFSRWGTCFILLFVVSVFFLFIGETPSLNRAWMGTLIYLISYLIRRDGYGLNTFGATLLISLILDPFALLNIGFQLSYAATFSIFTLYPWVNRLLQFLLPKRSLKIFQEMPRIDRLGYLFSLIIRKTGSLTLAVNFAILPLLLFHFGTFPMISLLYNMFFPITLLFAMILLILGMIFPIFLKLGSLWIKNFLEIIENGGMGSFWSLGNPGFETKEVVIFCTLLFFAGITLENYRYELTLIESRM
jgi:competence protein ComEC